MKRILYLSARTDLGGGPKHLLLLLTGLRQLNPNPADLSFYFAGPNEEPFGEKIIQLTQGYFPLTKRSFNLLAFFKLALWIRARKINIIHTPGRGAGLYGRLLGKILFIPVIHIFHGIHNNKSFLGQLKLTIDRLLAGQATHFIFCSEDERQEAYKMGVAKQKIPYAIIPNGIKIPLALSRPVASADRPFTMGVLARFTYQKGLDLLMKNLEHWHSTLPEKKRNWKFLIAGFGDEAPVIPPKIAGHVQLLGNVKDPEVFLSQLDLYVSNSRWEGMPLSVLEAFANGVPCLISAVPGHMAFIEEKTALEFSLDREEDFAQKLNALIAHPQTMNELAARARKIAEEEYSVAKMARETAGLYTFLQSP